MNVNGHRFMLFMQVLFLLFGCWEIGSDNNFIVVFGFFTIIVSAFGIAMTAHNIKRILK